MRRHSLAAMACCASFLSVVFVALPSGPAAAVPLQEFSYPTWEDIGQVRHEERKKQEKISEINELLDALESRTAEAGDQSVSKNREYLESQDALAQSQRKLEAQQLQVSKAQEKSNGAAQDVKKLIAQQYKTNGGLSIAAQDFFPGRVEEDRDRAIEQYVLAKRQRAFALFTQAHNTVRALTAQQRSVKEEHEALTRQANDSYNSALTAQEYVEEQVNTAKQRQQILLEQLASLKDTSAELEASYRQHERERRAYQEQQQAARERAEQKNSGQKRPSQPQAPGVAPIPPKGGSGGSDGEGQHDPKSPADNSPGAAKAYARNELGAYGLNAEQQFGCLSTLWEKESNWRFNAINSWSGAYGIPQALPGSKMASEGLDWQTNAATQIRWGLGYIKSRYGSPCAAWEHSQLVGWY